ncbi:hypothetical protein U9M48_026207 [Paspalum notatum var. saurae]|uniref:FLZ-type domain-containing protein n=1 Tax=Paspalum notatum var. saurae TaxID=547442 RepID=A0AAQ3WYJ6_PASNO
MAAAAKPVVPETMMLDGDDEEEERYVKVASRFFRVKRSPRGDYAGGLHYHYLGSCFLCKASIACDRDVFMYRDAAFCSVDCRDDQMDMEEALHAAARRHRLLLQRTPPSSSSSSSSSPVAEAASFSRTPVMRRRPTIANLAARNPPVAAS